MRKYRIEHKTERGWRTLLHWEYLARNYANGVMDALDAMYNTEPVRMVSHDRGQVIKTGGGRKIAKVVCNKSGGEQMSYAELHQEFAQLHTDNEKWLWLLSKKDMGITVYSHYDHTFALFKFAGYF